MKNFSFFLSSIHLFQNTILIIEKTYFFFQEFVLVLEIYIVPSPAKAKETAGNGNYCAETFESCGQHNIHC